MKQRNNRKLIKQKKAARGQENGVIDSKSYSRNWPNNPQYQVLADVQDQLFTSPQKSS